TFTVTPAPLTITPDAGQSMVYASSALPTLTYIASGFVNGDPTSLLTGLLGTTGDHYSATRKFDNSPVGSDPFTVGTLNAGTNYTLTLAPNPPTFAVTPASLTVSANNASRIYGVANPAFTASYSGFVNGDTAASLTTAPTLSTTATASSH